VTNIVCISHSEDVDGLICATLFKIAKNASYILTDYPTLHETLKTINKEVDTLYICDLALGISLLDEIKRISKVTKVVYIDHHPFKPGVLNSLEEFKVQIIHSSTKCAGMLTYQLLKKELPGDASILAAYATLSDYPYTNQEITRFLKQFDPHLLSFEYSILYYSVARAFDEPQFKHKIIDELSQLKYPHEIENVVHFAKEQVNYPLNLIRNPAKQVSYGNNLAYTEVLGSTSVVANTLMHILKKPILICYRKYGDGKHYHLSIRNKNRQNNLGALTSEIAKKVHGSGGGHPLAAAAQLPLKSFTKFVTIMDSALSESRC
jgi:RecJ-like exonuclease